MSDAKSSVEIEDVLSSIRRLVSEDLRPAPRPQNGPQNGQQSSQQNRPQIVSKMVMEDRLILTQALRVVPGKAGAAPGPKDRSLASLPPRLHLGPAHMTLAPPDVVTTLAQAVDSQALEWESETGDPGPEADGLDWSSFTFARRSPALTWAAQGQPAQSGSVAAKAVAAQTGSAGVAAPEAVAPQVVAPEAAAPEALAPQVGAGPVATQVVDLAELWQPAKSPEPQVAWTVTETLQAAPPQPDWVDAVEASVLAELQDIAPVAEVMPGLPQDEDSIFSEAVLRELVRDLLRAELQGDLGERITRNIRKLVRAEIARAMAVQSLE